MDYRPPREILQFLDSYTIDKCKEMDPKANLNNIGDNLSVFKFNEDTSSVFYKDNYIMSINWAIL